MCTTMPETVKRIADRLRSGRTVEPQGLGTHFAFEPVSHGTMATTDLA
jgi:hypothetical protein